MRAPGGVLLDARDCAECEAAVRRYLSRLLGRTVGPDHPHFAVALERLDVLLTYHAARFAEAGKPTDTRRLLRQLRAGRLAMRNYPDCDLVEDVLLALLMELGTNEAFCEFQRRFATQVERWARRDHPGEPDLADSLAGHIFTPRARSDSRIASYAGRAPLKSWLRRVVRNWEPEGQRAPVVQPDDNAGGLDGLKGRPLLHPPSRPLDVEFDRRNCGELLAPAFIGCFDELDDIERLVLLQHYVDGVQQNQIAEELHVRYFDVFRIKERAIARVRQCFHELAAGLVRGGRETVRACLELLRQRFSDLPVALAEILREKVRKPPNNDSP